MNRKILFIIPIFMGVVVASTFSYYIVETYPEIRGKYNHVFLSEWWVMAFITGGLVGTIISAIINMFLKPKEGDLGFTKKEFKTVVIPLISTVLKGNENVYKERLFLSKFLHKYFSKSASEEILAEFDENKDALVNFNILAEEVAAQYHYNSLKGLYLLLLKLCICDQYLTQREESTLITIGEIFGLSKQFIDHGFNIYNYVYEGQEQTRTNSNTHTQRKTYSKRITFLAVLSLTEEATEDDIKKAYRNLVKKHHPDKYSKSSQIEQDLAKERFIKIQEAYEYLNNS